MSRLKSAVFEAATIILLLTGIVLAVSLSGCGVKQDYRPTPLTPSEAGYVRPALAEFADECYGAGTASSMLGLGQDSIGIVAFGQHDEMISLECILNRLEAPSDTLWRMEHTRMLDGQQDVSWTLHDVGYAARWTYGGSTRGLSILISSGATA